MASQSETHNPIKSFHRRTSSRDQAVKISAPMLAYTDADNRHDLYALPSRTTRSVTPHSVRPTPSKLKKKIHISDLAVGRNPMFSSAAPTSVQKPAPSPTSNGVTLGSPTYWPSTRSHAGRASLDSHIPSSNNISNVPSGLQSTGGLNRESRRKLFTSIFGKKNSISTRDEFYKIRPSQISQTLVAVNDQQKINQRVERLPSTATAAPTTTTPWNEEVHSLLNDTRPGLKKSATMPFEYPSRPPSPPPKDFPPRPPVSRKKPSPNCPNCTPRSPMLKVAIPDVKMERYSVMFKDVIKPRQSLLARRHAQLKALQIADASIPEVPKIIAGSASELGATKLSSHLPSKSLIRERPNLGLGISQRAGLSRSNTVPNPVRQPLPIPAHPKRTDSRIVRARSPSHGSETPTSVDSEWQSQESPGASDTSDEDFDDDMCENIIVQLEDLSLSHDLPVQRGPGFTAELQDNSTFFFTLKQPITESAHPRNFPKRSQYSTKDSLHDKNIATKQILLPYSATPREDSATLPPEHQSMVRQQQQQVMPSQPYSQQTEARPIRHLNPLKSSPASPTEITTARQLSWTRSNQIALVNTKQAIQPQVTAGARTGSVSELKMSNILTVGHARNKSEHVVVESV